jgi:hypothetical protein
MRIERERLNTSSAAQLWAALAAYAWAHGPPYEKAKIITLSPNGGIGMRYRYVQ